MTTNDIVINKLTQILSYLRQGVRANKKGRKKDKDGIKGNCMPDASYLRLISRIFALRLWRLRLEKCSMHSVCESSNNDTERPSFGKNPVDFNAILPTRLQFAG